MWVDMWNYIYSVVLHKMIPGSVNCNLHVSVCMKQINNTNSYRTFCHIYIFNPVIT